jgi:hypothetical protein
LSDSVSRSWLGEGVSKAPFLNPKRPLPARHPQRDRRGTESAYHHHPGQALLLSWDQTNVSGQTQWRSDLPMSAAATPPARVDHSWSVVFRPAQHFTGLGTRVGDLPGNSLALICAGRGVSGNPVVSGCVCLRRPAQRWRRTAQRQHRARWQSFYWSVLLRYTESEIGARWSPPHTATTH